MTYSHLDLLALGFFLLCWFGYAWFAGRHAADRPSLVTVMNPLRDRWFEQTLTRENRIVDSALLSNLMNSATFFSSTTLLALGGLLALFGSVEKSAEIIENLPFAQRTSQQLLEAKVITMILLFVYALIKFTWSVRQFNFVTIVIGSIAPRDELTADDRLYARRAAGILKLAGENFSQGLRAYYFSVALLLWFVQPWFFIAATALVTIMLYRMEFHSRTLAVLCGDGE
ncbi:MAG: DUF599 domain-containing protein [Burkholderiales bacterium]|nr:DUF599 domain-containing protein [Burkholderiales bacterium]